MSRTRHVKGKSTKSTKGAHNMYSNGDINANAGGIVQHKGDGGVNFKNPDKYSGKQNETIIQVFNDTTEIKPNDFAFITDEPVMPKISIKATLKGKIQKVWACLTITNTIHKRSDKDIFPENDQGKERIFYELSDGQQQSIDFGNKFRGGSAVISVFSSKPNDKGIGPVIKTVSFNIRGKNPAKSAVKQYLNDKSYLSEYWFMLKLIISESGSKDFGIIQQFNEPTKSIKYGSSGTGKECGGMPMWGTPDGWGMGQLDWSSSHKKVPADALWSWKINADYAKEELDKKKKEQISSLKNIMNGIKHSHISKTDIQDTDPQVEGLITYVDGKTSMSGFDDINPWMGDAVTNDNTKSFLDADLIKRYNGGKYLSFDTTQKKWDIQNMNNFDPPFDYVERVSNIAD